jgi:NhaP-type Na+/H+ or K+/H+ antiporter
VASGELIVILAVAAVTLLAVASLRRVGVPTAAVLVVAGLVIGFLPFVPDASLDPHVVLLALLPLLVFDAAATSSATAFVRNARSIGLLAVGLVGATALSVAAVPRWDRLTPRQRRAWRGASAYPGAWSPSSRARRCSTTARRSSSTRPR